ncbi:MAG: glycoside hydrolase family 95 protein [Eubacteriales bacterium]
MKKFEPKNDLCFWYRKPAKKYWDGLPMGTGRFFGMLHGSETKQILTFNEETFWTGRPYNPTEAKSPEITNKVKQLIAENKLYQADEYSKHMIGVPNMVQMYQPLASLNVHIKTAGRAKNYIRCLDMENALITTGFLSDGISYTTETFASFPHQVIVHRIGNSANHIELLLNFDCLHTEKTITFNGFEYSLACRPSSIVDEGLFDKKTEMGNLLRAMLTVKIGGEDVRIAKTENGIQVSGKEIILYLAAATNYVSGKDCSADEKMRVSAYLSNLSGYDSVKKAHLEDYGRLFNKVEIQIGKPGKSLDTTTRLMLQRAGLTDLPFIAQYFQFGRYITLCGAREGTLAFNNHNPWLDNLKGKWHGRWTLNINLQECYWYIDSAGLSPLFDSLLAFIEALSESGKVTAKQLYGAGGWVCHHGTDIWFNTAPTDYNATHSVYPTANAWLCYHLFEHFEYTLDKAYLKRALPVMEGAAEFLKPMLIEKDGFSLMALSHSPENSFKFEGKKTSLSMGCYHDTELIKSLFLNINKARKFLSLDEDEELAGIVKGLPPYKINSRGGLNEWYFDYPEYEKHHRHLSHLFAVYPYNDITPEKTPELAKAALKTIMLRGKYEKGWPAAWRINLLARLKQPEWAFKQLKIAVRSVSKHPSRMDSYKTPSYEGNQAIQGIGAGLVEMLMQSDGKTIKILPALSRKMQSGFVKGLRAKGGYETDIYWQKGRLEKAVIRAKNSGRITIETEKARKEITLEKGEIYVVTG